VGGQRKKERERRKIQLLSESVAVEVAPLMKPTVRRIGMTREMKTGGTMEILLNEVGWWLYSP